MTDQLLVLQPQEKPTKEMPFLVKPRHFAKKVYISKHVFTALCKAQKNLPHLIVLRRGYEPNSKLANTFRLLGKIVFVIRYPHRINEIKHIYSANGHDSKQGNSIDVGIYTNKHLRILPWYHTFVSKKAAKQIYKTNKKHIDSTWEALEEAGFKKHCNFVESLQIHVDLER